MGSPDSHGFLLRQTQSPPHVAPGLQALAPDVLDIAAEQGAAPRTHRCVPEVRGHVRGSGSEYPEVRARRAFCWLCQPVFPGQSQLRHARAAGCTEVRRALPEWRLVALLDAPWSAEPV